jgi:hypothetical protein
MGIIDMIKNLPIQIWLVAGVVVIYFLFSLFFPKNKNKTPEETKQSEYEKSRKHKTNYRESYSTSYREATADVYRPSDGTAVHSKGAAGYRKIDKHNHTKETLDRQKQYEVIFSSKIRNLNHIGRELGITNDEVVKDLKYFKRKKHMFQNVVIDYKNCKVSYGDDFEDEEEIERELYNENIEEENVSNEEYFDNDNQLKRKCPKCGTVNIIDINDKEYRCFCCLSKNVIE